MTIPAVLSGSSATTQVVGPFFPKRGRAVTLELTGTWTGSVAVQRSTEGGTTKTGLTAGGVAWGVFTGNTGGEIVWEEGDEQDARLYLSITRDSGTVVYRLS
jgi:hypothetical protein